MAEIQNIIELTFTEADGSAFAASALESANRASESELNAFRYAGGAQASADSAREYNESARQYAESSHENMEDAIEAKNNAQTAAQQAEMSATNASNYSAYAFNYANDAQTHAQTANTAATNASASASSASNSASSASNSATTARSNATTATQEASNAQRFSTTAQAAAETAENKASEAAQSAATATTKASEASDSAATATTKASEASTSATTAQQAAQQAQTVYDSIPSDYSELDGIVEDVTEPVGKNLLNGRIPRSVASNTIYSFDDNTMTFMANTAGSSVTTYAIFDLGIPTNDYASSGITLTVSATIAEKMGANVAIHLGVIDGQGNFTRLSNWVNSNVTGYFTRTGSITATTLTTHAGKNIAVRIYGGYQVTVTLDSKAVYENMMIEVGRSATEYEPYLTAIDVTARKELDVLAKKADAYQFNAQAFKPMWINSELFVNNYTIAHHGESETNKVSKLYTLYNSLDSTASSSGITVTKELLGTDASNTFNIYNYKASLNTGDKPVVLLIVGEHGDELNSAMLGYYAYREIIDGVLTKYLEYVDFWVIPLMNPWGYENNSRNNSNGVNLNRDFPCEWQYSTDEHNATGNTALSQPETNLVYNLIVTNKDKILFMCNKHDTGPIAYKIGTNQEDIVGFMSSYCDNDIVVNNGMSQIQNKLVRQTDAWIINDCSIDISDLKLIASRHVLTSGSLDLFANSIGVHGSLVEVCSTAISADYPYYPSGLGHHADLARLGLNLFVNYLMTTIENNMDVLYDNRLYGDVGYYSRKLVDGSYVDIELEWTGTGFVEKA